MHEMALCESILGILEEQSGPQGYSRVQRVRLEVGALACVEPEALAFNFEVVTRGTLAEDAELEIVREPGQAWCLMCARTVEMQALVDACPLCGSHQTQVTGGDGMRIKEMEVE